MRLILGIASLVLCATAVFAQDEPETFVIGNSVKVRIVTSMGDIVVDLNAERAPLTVQNFIQYVINGHYEGTIFHRIATGFIVQGGGYREDLTLKPAARTVVNESGNGLSNLRGTIAMARSNEPHGANSQFYFNLVSNNNLNPRPTRWGYTVFGEVVEGMEVVDQMGAVPTGPAGEFERDVPIDPIIIERIDIIEE